jgi:hypothetical protein
MNDPRVCSINKETGLPSNQSDRDPRNAGALLAAECGNPAHFKVIAAGTDTVVYACFEHMKELHNMGLEVTELEN